MKFCITFTKKLPFKHLNFLLVFENILASCIKNNVT